jgi:drug/metabolite transporter (DMT)-like permease
MSTEIPDLPAPAVPGPATSARPHPGAIVDVALLVLCFFWAGNMIVLKLLLGVVPPPVLSTTRFVIVAVVGVVVAAASGVSLRVERRDWPRVAASAVLGVSLYQIVFIEGLDRTSAFVSNLMQGTEPLFALFLVRLSGTGRVTAAQWLGVMVALVGAGVFFMPDAGPWSGLAFGFGDLLNLVAALVFATYGLVSAPLFVHYPGATVMAWTMALGTVPLLFWAARPLAAQDWASIRPLVWLGLVLSAVLTTYVGFWIWNWAVSHKGLAHASLFIFVDIVLSGVLAYLILGERFGATRLLGAAIILAGVYMARR